MIDRQYKAFGGAEKAEYPRSTPIVSYGSAESNPKSYRAGWE